MEAKTYTPISMVSVPQTAPRVPGWFLSGIWKGSSCASATHYYPL